MKNLMNILLLIALFALATLNKVDRRNRPEDCAEIKRNNGNAATGEYTIYPPNRDSIKVHCDMTTENGGWTKIAHVSHSASRVSRVPNFDDFNLNYSHVLIRTNPGHWLRYSGGNAWIVDGWSLPQNFIRFGANDYYYLNPGQFRGCGARGGFPWDIVTAKPRLISQYIENRYYKVLKRPVGKRCNFGGRHKPTLCATEFIVMAPARIRGFGDVESETNGCTGDNSFHYDVDFYVR